MSENPELEKKDPDDLMTVGEVARRLGVSEKTVRRWQYQRKLRAVKVGGWAVRYTRSSVEALIKEA
jgi:excisionase family DNA binding protein